MDKNKNINEKILEGEKLIAGKNYVEAKRIFSVIYKEFPNDGRVLYNMGLISIALNKINEAEAYFEKAIDRGYVNYKVLTSLALVEKTLGNMEKTLELLEQAEKLKINNLIPKILLLSEFMEQKRFEDAWSFFQEKKELYDWNSLGFLQIKAQLASQLKMKDEAMDAYKALYENYQRSDAAISIATLLLMDSKSDEADKYLMKIITQKKLGRDYYFALLMHAQCLEKQNKEASLIEQAYKDAISVYEEAYKKSKINAYVMQLAAECYNALGDKKNEERCLKLIQEICNVLTDNNKEDREQNV